MEFLHLLMKINMVFVVAVIGLWYHTFYLLCPILFGEVGYWWYESLCHISCTFCFWFAVCFLILFRTLSHIQFFLFFLFSQIYQFYFWFDGHLNSLKLTVQYNVGNWLHIFNHLKKCLCICNNIYKYTNFLVVSLFHQRYRLNFITCFYCTILDDAMVVMTWCYLFIWWIIVIGFVMLNHVIF